jgi:SpoVK/Ycf46/Vps4 family AAA+-type ATPase
MGSVKTEIKILEKQADINKETAQREDFKSRLMLSVAKGNKIKNVHYVLTGNPGTGKTTAARLLGEILNELGYLERGHTVKVSRDDLVAGYVGQTAIKTKEKINEAMGGVLFIDEAYSLVQGGDHDFGQEAINTLVEAMTDRMGQFAVVAAGYPKQMADFLNANPGLSDRFVKVIPIEDYNAEELLQIFNMNMKKENYTVNDKLMPLIGGFFENWHRFAAGGDNWANARSVEKLVDQMYGSWCLRDGEKSQNMPLLDICDIPADLQIHCKPVSEAKKDAIEKLNNLVGLKRVKERIKELRRNIKIGGGVPEPGHYVFSGNPGTGKTTVAKLLGDIFCDIGVLRRGHVVAVGRDDLVGVHVGETAPKTKKQLEKALDGILFIDEAYRLYERSDSYNYGKESIDTILPFMEDNRDRICVICAGYTVQMDNFIKSNEGLRSRFTETIVFDDYNTDELLQILNSFSEAEGLVLEKKYIEKSRTVFDFWTANKGPDFGNARDVRNYVKECKNALYRRLEFEYQNPYNVPENAKKTLTGKDIPDKY